MPVGSVHATRPAATWQDAQLAGNGRHGAMVFGDILVARQLAAGVPVRVSFPAEGGDLLRVQHHGDRQEERHAVR